MERFKKKAELRILSFVRFIQNLIETIKDYYKTLQIAFEDFDKKVIIYYYI